MLVNDNQKKILNTVISKTKTTRNLIEEMNFGLIFFSDSDRIPKEIYMYLYYMTLLDVISIVI